MCEMADEDFNKFIVPDEILTPGSDYRPTRLVTLGVVLVKARGMKPG